MVTFFVFWRCVACVACTGPASPKRKGTTGKCPANLCCQTQRLAHRLCPRPLLLPRACVRVPDGACSARGFGSERRSLMWAPALTRTVTCVADYSKWDAIDSDDEGEDVRRGGGGGGGGGGGAGGDVLGIPGLSVGKISESDPRVAQAKADPKVQVRVSASASECVSVSASVYLCMCMCVCHELVQRLLQVSHGPRNRAACIRVPLPSAHTPARRRCRSWGSPSASNGSPVAARIYNECMSARSPCHSFFGTSLSMGWGSLSGGTH